MSSIDFNSVDSGQARLEAVAKAKESPQDLKQRLAQYRQTYINEVDGQQRTLNADANAFVAKDAQQYLKDAAKSLGNSVVNLAVEGENLQRRGIAAAAAPSGQVEPTEKPAALDFSTLAGLKKAVQSELAGQTGELAVWRQIEQIGGNFEKGWQNYQKSFAKAPSLEGLSANLAARQAQKTTLEGIRKQYEAIKPTAGSLRAWQEDSRDMAVFLTRIDLHLKEGEKVLETRAALTAQQAGLGTVEKTLRAAKTLTAEEFAQHLSSLQKQGQDLAGLQSIITQGAGATGEFTGLYPALLERYHQPLSDRLTQLHGLLEIKKPVPPASEQEKTDGEKAGEGKDANPIPAEQEHRFRLFIGGAQSTLSAIDKRVGTLEKELAAAAKKPDLWLNRTDYDAWLSRLDTELGASTDIKNELESWERKTDQAPAAKDFLNRYFQPAWRRAQSLRDRADRERGEAVKNNEKKILNQKVAEMHAELLREWQGKKESEQYLSISDKLSGLKPEDKEYQTLAAKQDALAKDLISFEGKVAFLLSKPDDLEKDVLTALQKIQADCRQWQNQIGGDRVLRQSRTAAAIEPDQPHPYTVERRTRAFVKAGPGGGGHWEDRVEKEEKTEHYKFGQYVQFVSIHDPKHAPAGGQEGRGWIWINGGEKLPDQVRQALSNRADLIVREQKDQVDAQSGRERREVRQQDLLTPKGREVLGADGARYFAGVDFLAKGDVQKAMAEFNAYLEVAKEFDAAKQELHAGCIEDANRHIESHRDFPEFLNALKLQAEGKIDEAVKQFRAFLARVNAKFGGAMGSELVGPEHPDRQKYAEQINVAIEVIKKFNNDKLKILDELSKDFIYLQTVDRASRIGKVSPLDFANLKGAQREMMLPYIPAERLTPAERIRQSRQMGGLSGGEIGAIKDAIKNLREKIEKGDPPVDFESEFAAIKADLNKYTETTPGGSVWKDPNTNAVLANSPSSRLLVYFNQLNSSDPAVREKGFLAVAAEFKEREVGMRYTQKYLRQAMVSRYRAFAETEDGKSVATEVRKRLAADPATHREITVNARELYKRWAAEQKPPLPADPPDPIVMQSFKQNISDSIFEDQYEREMRRTMTSRGNAADDAARYLYINNSVPSSSLTPWKDLSRERKLTWLAQVADGDLGVALLDGGALKQYNWSRPYDEGDAKWYKPWSWKNYNEDAYNAFKAEAAEIAIQTVATLPIGFGAGAVGRVIGLGAVKLLVREGLTEAAVGALSRGGLRALMVAEKAGEKAIWSTLSSGMKARLLMHYGVGIAVEGTALAVMNSVWEGMYHGRADLFDSLDGGKYGKAGLFILENIAKAGLFRSIGAGQMGVSGLAGPNAKLLSRVLAESSGETVFGGFGGAGVEALFMLHDPKMREQLTWEWFAKSVLQNAAGSVAMRAGHSGMRLPEMGVFKGSREGTARRLTAAEIQLNGERLAARGIHTPADISNARIEANGDLVLRLKSGKDQIIKYSEIPFDRLPPEIRNHLYQTDKNNRDSLRAVLAETGLDSPLNWTGVTDDGAVVSTTGRIVPIADPALLPPALREKHRLLVEERRQARLGPYRRPGRVEPDQPTVIRAEAAPAAKPETPTVKTDTPANKATPGAEIAPDALRPAPETPPRLLPPGEASTRLTGVRNTLKLYEQRTKLSADPKANATELARLETQIAAAAKAKNLSPEQYRRQLQTDEKLYRGLDALDRGERQLYGESKVIKKPVLDENGIQKKDANGQLIYQEVNLFANYESKSAAYSREMLRSLSYERLVAEGGGKIIKLGGDELVVYHAGPDGTVQKLFIDISNMGPTNDTATNIAGSKVNLVDIYLHRLSEAVLAQSKANQGKLLDPGAFNAEVLRVADSLFNLDRDAGGKPLDATEAAKRFDRLKAEWGLEGNFQEYLTDIQSMRILAEYRADTRALDSSYKNHPERTFTEHISAEIQAISGLTIPQLQQLIAANSTEFRTAFEGRLPKSPKLKAMPIDKLLKQIKSLDPASSKPEDLMMLYAMLARMDTATLSAIPALKPFSDKLAASRTALVGDPPHPRVEEPRLMDAKVVSIDLPPDIAKALSALAETDPVRAHAILATARQFSEKSLDALKYGQRGRFAKFDITTYVEVKNGQLQVKPDAPDFLRAVETSRSDKKIGNVIDAEDSLRLARSKMETLQQQLADGKISHEVFLQQIMVVEVEIGILTTKLSIDPDTGAYGQAYLDVRPTTMYHFPDGVLPPENRVWHSVVTELGHSGVINAKYGYQAMDGIMANYYQVLQRGIAAELPANLQHFKIIRSGGGKFEVAFLDSRAVAHLAAKGLTPHQLIERLANGPGQQAVDRVLQADPKKVAASQTDAAVRNSQFRYNKGTEMLEVGQLTSTTGANVGNDTIARLTSENPRASARGIIGKSLKLDLVEQRATSERVNRAEEVREQARAKVEEIQRQIEKAKNEGADTKDLEKAMKSAKTKLDAAEQNLSHEQLAKTVRERNPSINSSLIDGVLRNHPEFTAEQLAKKSPDQLKQLMEATQKVDTIKAELANMSPEVLRDYVMRFNRENPPGLLSQQEFQVLRVTEEGVIMVDQQGKLVETIINEGNAVDVLREFKSLDDSIRGQSYQLRSECLRRSGGAIVSDFAYTYGEVPKGGKVQDAFLDNRGNWLPERQQLHDLILSAEFEKAKALSERLGDKEPTIYALRGNTAAGKTTRLRNDRDFARTGDTNGAINPDTYKAQLRSANSEIDYTPTAYQVHEEGSMLARRLSRSIELAKPPLSEMSMVIDKRLNKTKNITELIATAERLHRPVKILDVDSPLEISCQRVLTRAIAGEDPAVPFGAVAEGFEGIRQNRRALIEQVKNNPTIKEYVLYVTDENGQSVKAAEKRNGEFVVLDRALYEQARNGNTEEAVDRVRTKVIDDAYIQTVDSFFRPFLERYRGKTLGQALDAHSKITVEPHDQAFYMRAAMDNLNRTSRTAQGVVDTSASTDKAAKMAEGLTDAEAAQQAKANYQKVMQRLFAERSRPFTSPDEVRAFVESVGRDINAGIVKEGVLLRAGEDSKKYPYTKIADLPKALQEFYQDFFQRVNDPHQDPVELAAWVEYRVNISDHIFADGCGKSALALVSFVLMRNNLPLPQYQSKMDTIRHSPKTIRGVDPAADAKAVRDLTGTLRRRMAGKKD